jgi:hypothetical protein
MRTPVRLALALRQAKLDQYFGREKKYSPIHCVRVPDNHSEDILPASEHTTFLAEPAFPKRRGQHRRAPALWLTGDADPLAHPGVGRVTRQLQDSHRTVFLETCGSQLRRRIHEFHPDDRLYLTIRVYGTADIHDLRVAQPGAFALAMEGARAAQLSGHLICVHIVIDAETKFEDIKLLLQHIGGMEADGVVVTAASMVSPEPPTVRQLVFAARSLVGNSWWASLSADVELALGASHKQTLFVPALKANPLPDGATVSGDQVVAQ